MSTWSSPRSRPPQPAPTSRSNHRRPVITPSEHIEAQPEHPNTQIRGIGSSFEIRRRVFYGQVAYSPLDGTSSQLITCRSCRRSHKPPTTASSSTTSGPPGIQGRRRHQILALGIATTILIDAASSSGYHCPLIRPTRLPLQAEQVPVPSLPVAQPSVTRSYACYWLREHVLA